MPLPSELPFPFSDDVYKPRPKNDGMKQRQYNLEGEMINGIYLAHGAASSAQEGICFVHEQQQAPLRALCPVEQLMQLANGSGSQGGDVSPAHDSVVHSSCPGQSLGCHGLSSAYSVQGKWSKISLAKFETVCLSSCTNLMASPIYREKTAACWTHSGLYALNHYSY